MPKHRADQNTTDMASRADCTGIYLDSYGRRMHRMHLSAESCPVHHPRSYAHMDAKHRKALVPSRGVA